MLGKFDARAMVIAGLLCFAVSCLLDISLTAESVGHDFYASQFLRGVGQMLAMMPLNQASMSAVSREEAGDAAGLYNMARNLGGSVGLALIGVYIDRRNAFHDDHIRESVTANSLIGQDHMAATSAGFIAQHGDTAMAHQQALEQLAGPDSAAGLGDHVLRDVLRAGDRAAALYSPRPLPQEADAARHAVGWTLRRCR